MVNNYRAILADIKTKMNAISGIGIVHQYERQVTDLGKFILLFKDQTGKICGWEITRRAVSEHRGGAFFRHHQFVLKGYMGLQDSAASSISFQELCEEVCNVFRVADPATPGVSWNYLNGDDINAAPAQIDTINDRMFGAVLCHCSEISLSVNERIIA